MPIIAPVLDDRSFEQIYSELVNRIPVYNPEWTDYNHSDPAITLLQLFAYLGESLQFRFNQIPEATQLAFLRLLDLPLSTARPATALLQLSTEAETGVAVYAGDQAKAGKTLFTIETDAEIWPIDSVAVARKPTNAPDLNDEPELYALVQSTLDTLADQYAKLDLGKISTYRSVVLKSDSNSPPLDFADAIDGCLWIAVLKNPKNNMQLASGRLFHLNVGFSPATRTPSLNQITHCSSGANRPGLEWRISLSKPAPDGSPLYTTARVLGDTTEGFTKEGVVRIELSVALAELGVPEAPLCLEGTGDYPPLLDEATPQPVWFWIKVWRSDNSRIGVVRLVCVNAVECVQAVTALPEFLGSGSGQPGQVFTLANRPVLLDELHQVKLQVEENQIWTDWTQQDDLDTSGPDDRHFTVDAEAGTVRFGECFPQIGERVRVLSYRYGGGLSGNVSAGVISKFGDPLPGSPSPPGKMKRLDNAKCINPFPAEGGADSESMEQGLKRIPGELRRRDRAMTADDFSELAMLTPGVEIGRAECLPLFHAPDQTSPKAGTVSVIIWPAKDHLHPNAPVPDADELKRVCRWLDSKRLVTTELYVIPPTYKRIALSLSARIKPGYGLDAVRNWIELVLRQYLAPLPPYGPDGAGWPLGRQVFARELEGVVMLVEGVEFVSALHLAAESGGVFQEIDVAILKAWEVPELAAITIVDDNTQLPAPGKDVPPPASGAPVPVPVLREIC